ncbi:Smr/MutS family protein [Lewinella sp. W8]|uniref:Smr/MutS family protein n=1 Tax=Lewinella sp. W8 TaxID=2528208 RepID=UPI001067D99F|nr:Smr/MutS family protein [Lewinella sp. W8]MTB51094.1 hypothetical protein [Lewinella sp. W8]
MEFAVGQRVRMKRTENFGTVTRLLPGGLVQVKLDGGMGHLPLPEESLELVPTTPPPPAEKEDVPAADPVPEAGDYPGVELAFDPQLNNQAEPVAYEVYLLNGTPHKIIYELRVLTHGQRRWAKFGQLEGGGKKRLEAIDYQWLNEKLSCQLDVRPILTGGTGPRHFQDLRIRGKQFFARYVDVPRLHREAHLYNVFPRLDTKVSAPAASPSGPSLKAITAQQLASRPKKGADKKLVATDLASKLEFEEVLDLHLEALVKDPKSVPRHQVLSTQLRYFDDYLERALRLGVDQVFIVHGVGNGVLKKEIHKRLRQTPFIRKFTNEYHPKFGYGATEVTFD